MGIGMRKLLPAVLAAPAIAFGIHGFTSFAFCGRAARE
jgi:hypothetical protein